MLSERSRMQGPHIVLFRLCEKSRIEHVKLMDFMACELYFYKVPKTFIEVISSKFRIVRNK